MADYGVGFKYQCSVTAYLASLLSKDPRVKDYRILYEVQEFYPFDDIVLVVNYHESNESRLYVIQAKSGKIKLEINKYLKGYNDIMKTKNLKCLENIGIITKDNIQFWYYACQNLSAQTTFLQEGSDKTELKIKPRMLENNQSIICHKVYELTSTDKEIANEHKNFFNDFYIFVGQPNAYIITNKLKDMWQSNDAPQIIEYLDKYFTTNKKGSLSKWDFEHELLRLCLSDSIVIPTKIIPYMEETAVAWNNFTLSHNVIIVKSEAGIESCLFGCISRSINDRISIDEWNAFIEKGGRLSKEFKAKMIKSPKPETLKDFLIQLWIGGEIPLILKPSYPIPLLKEFAHLKRHYIVLDLNPEERYKEMKSYSLNAIKNLDQSTAEELLQKVLVSMQGGKPASLHTVINNDKTLAESLTCSDILQLIEPRRLFLNRDCLEDHNYRLFIIETDNADLLMNSEDFKANGDNICVYVQCDESKETCENFRRDPRLKYYIIYQLRLDDNKLILTGAQRLNNYSVDIEDNDENECNHLLGLEDFQIDQYGKRIYSINKDHNVPIIGDVKKSSCMKYLCRRMRKGTLVINAYGNLLNDDTTDSVIKFSGTTFPDQDFFKEMRGKICVVTGEAGIGKTTLLQSLVQICDSQYYVLFCNLVQFQGDMRSTTKKLSKDPLHFFWGKQGPLAYEHFLNILRKTPNRIIVILDSFDEVIPSCKEQALELIRKLNEEISVKKIIIGSRLLTVDLLISQFKSEVAKVENFSLEDNDLYVENWGFSTSDLQNTPAEFATNPLYLDMLRIISQTSNVDFQTLNRWNLYQGIMNSKINRYNQLMLYDDIQTENMVKFHRELAAKFIFGSNQVTEKFAVDHRMRFSNFARLGIITYFDENDEPVFIHHTFAEFLAAEWLIKATNKEDAKYIYELILTNHQLDVLSLHSEQFPVHKAVLDITSVSDKLHLEQMEELCKRNKQFLLQVDGIGRTALHIAAIRYRAYNGKCLETIITNMYEGGYDLYLCDRLMNWTWIDYCEKNLRFDIAEVCPKFFTIHKAYWSYYASQISHLNLSVLREKLDFKHVYDNLVSYPSLFNIIDDLLFVRYFDNEDFVRFRNLCMRSESSDAELPEYFKLDELNITPLDMAIIYSNVDVVTACIQRGDCVNAVDSSKYSPLYHSICKQDIGIVELLLNCDDIYLELDSCDKINIFQVSLQSKNKDITKMLMEKIDMDSHGSDCLYDAVQFGDVEVLEMLLEIEIDLNKEVLVDVIEDTFQREIISRDICRTFRRFHNYNYDITAMPLNELLRLADAIKNLYKLLFSEHNKYYTQPLVKAIVSGRTDIVEILLKNGAKVNLEINIDDDNYFETESNNTTPLCYAVKSMNADIVDVLLQNNANVNNLGSDGFTPLTAVVHNAREDTFQNFFNNLVKDFREEVNYVVGKLACRYRYEMPFYITRYMNATEKFDYAVIRRALVQRSYELVEILLKYGADVNCKAYHHLTPLDMAILYQNIEMAEFLLRNGVNPHCMTFNLLTVLEFVSVDNIKILELLLKNGANPNFKNKCDMTPLYMAARKGSPDMVRLLFEYGANANIVTCTNTLLTKALDKGEISAAIWLLGTAYSPNLTWNSVYPNEVLNLIQTVQNQAKTIDIIHYINFIEGLSEDKMDLSNTTGMCYINALLELDNKEVDQIFLNNFMEHYSEEVDRYTAIGYAAKQKNDVLIAILARNGQDVNSTNQSGSTALVSLIRENVDKSAVELLLENQADVNMATKLGYTPLMTAIYTANIDVVKLLLKSKAIANCVNKDGLTPLIAAINKEHFAITSILLNSGADVNFVYKGGPAPIYVAILKGNKNIIKMLLSYGANLDIETCGNTLLYNAIKSNYHGIVSILLHKIDLDRLSVPGYQDVVERIFRSRADINTVYECGSTPLDLAQERGTTLLLQNLLRRDTDRNQKDYYNRKRYRYTRNQ